MTMTLERIQERIRELEEQIQNSYRNYSDVDRICTTSAVPDGGKFRQFAKKILIEREHITDESHVLILDNFGSSTAQAETNYIIRELKQKSIGINVNEINYDVIRKNVTEMNSSGITPDAILLPITYFHNVWEWNSPAVQKGLLRERIGDQLFINHDLILPIIFSNKYIPFEEVFIVSKTANLWEYRPDTKTNGRLTSDFDWDYNDPQNVTVLVRTIFQFSIRNNYGNRVLIPENIPKDD